MNELMNLIDVAYIIDNFKWEMLIVIIFSAFAHLVKSKKGAPLIIKLNFKFYKQVYS